MNFTRRNVQAAKFACVLAALVVIFPEFVSTAHETSRMALYCLTASVLVY